MNDLEKRIRSAIDSGDKLGAIKLVREASGLGLAEAKAAVEKLERGEPLGVERSPSAPGSPPEVPPELPPEVVELARAGRTIDAIKRLRELRPMQLRDAKLAVDQVPLDPGAKKQGCLGGLLLVLGLGGALLFA